MPDPIGQLNGVLGAQQKFIATVLSEKPDKLYRIDDFATMRDLLFQNVKDAIERRFPLYNDRYSMSVDDLRYEGSDELPVDIQKKAIMDGASCTRKLTGSWVLTDNKTGKEVSRTRRMTVMRVPHMTDRGTFIRNGHEYAFTNIMRLEPGTYCRRRPDDINAQFNIQKGSGAGFNMSFKPDTGRFFITRGATNAPAYTVLRDMGVSDDVLKGAWGEELFKINKEYGTGEKARLSADKIYNM